MFRRLACSFCGRSAADVETLVAGPRVYICDRCAAEAVRIKAEGEAGPTLPPRSRRGWSFLPTRSLALLGCLLVGLVPLRAQSPVRPNVVLIITDDMGWADIGSYAAPDARTPHIDSLARDGVKLTDFYANGVSCSPTRAGLMTGRYQQRYGIETFLPNEGGPGADRGLVADGRSLPRLVKNSGYATALVGKWHLGYSADQGPNAHGFDYFFGLKSGYHDYYTHHAGHGKPDLWENERPVEVAGYMTDLITDRAVQFIEQNAGRPFFIDIAYNAPHFPYQVPDQPSVAPGNARHVLPTESPTNTRAEYVAMVERMDRGVGEVLRALDRLKLASNTIVIFTNDNGGEWLSNNGPLFNRKFTVWEGGIRVPALVRWPGRIPAGRVSGQVGITMDLAVSILSAIGASVPADVRFEGIDLFPALEGRVPASERTLFWRSSAGNRLQKAVRRGDLKLMIDGNHAFVFDVRADPGERRDLASSRQAVAKELSAALAVWERDVDAEGKKPAK